ncbi:uncharacterized protein [Henckelia pumila]|uniref:uncharacterized protein n=1 Tax=Henckelia pumila TaxID=405737 RepID=UPI003C6DE9E7
MESGVGSSSNLVFLGTCKCKGQLFVISNFSGCSLEDIFLSLSSKYEEINPLSMSLQYLAPQHKMYVTLNDNDDVRNMIHLHMCMKLSMIELRAELKDQIRGGFNMERHKVDNLFGIRKCNLQHTCGEDNLCGRGHPRADATWVANLMKEKLRAEPSYRPSLLLKDIHRNYGVELEYRKVWKGKELAMHDIYGTEKDCYDKLRWYCRNVRETNPGSVAEYEIDALTNKFKRLFICFNACANGFSTGCRPMIFLDGTHIKNKYKGSILVAVGKDANDNLFTLAYSVVDAENDCNWEWFCINLRSVLLSQHISGFENFTFFSDRHSGIIKAVNLLFPGSHHAYCLRHLVDNFVKQVMRSYPLHNKKHWSSVFKKASYAPSHQEAWEINMLPCKHACAAIKSKSLSLYSFCYRYFHIDMYRQAYKGIINLIPTFDMNEDSIGEGSIINAPDVRSQPGRRKTKRIPSQVETRVAKCGRCRKRGHNRRSCKEAIE